MNRRLMAGMLAAALALPAAGCFHGSLPHDNAAAVYAVVGVAVLVGLVVAVASDAPDRPHPTAPPF